MKKLILADTQRIDNKKYSTYTTLTYRGNEYSIYESEEADYIDNLNSVDAMFAAGKFRMQIRRIAPYDNAEYVWCRTEGAVAKFYRGIVHIKTMRLPVYRHDNYEYFNEYVLEAVERCLDELIKLNANVKPQIAIN